MNLVFLVGRLGKDPELKYLPDGRAATKFSLATSKRFKDKAGNRNERTAWHNITAYGKLAEICGEHLKSGSQISCVGEINYQEWEKDNQKHWRTEIIISDMEMLGKKEVKDEQQPTAQLDNADIPF